MNLHRKLSAFGALLFCAGTAHAALQVDVNQNNGRKDAQKPNWQNWAVDNGASATQKFDGVTVTLRGAPGGLATMLFKAALDTGAGIAADGVTAGTIEMVLGGLAPGKHTLVTYHNTSDNGAPPPLDISVDGKIAVRGVVPSVRALNDYDMATAFVEFSAEAGKDVVVAIVPNGANGKAILNGFEIDTTDPARRATRPQPAHDDEHVAENTALTWTPAQGASAQLVYFGADKNAVAEATPQSKLFQGRRKEARFSPPPLNHRATYFWRVDQEINGEIVRGEVWRFRQRFLAFPTAEGYGRFARGGRDGRVIEVTTLQDYDPKNEAPIPGSFRAAVEAEGPRTIVFRVSGVIRLKAPCPVRNSYCTIAGQTAPGDGICIANFPSGAYTAKDVIIRFMRYRIGDFAKKGVDGAGLGSCDHAIMDHCSISWGSDENTSSRGAKNITFQRNIVSEALHHSYHYNARDRSKFSPHAFAGSISGDIGSFHHNLLAHCTDRNWSLAGGYNQGGQYAGHLDIRNNVVYNWTKRTTDGGVMRLNYVNNYYKPYAPNNPVNWLLKLDPIDTSHGTPRYFMSGNVMEGFDYENDNWKAFTNGADVEKLVRVNEPLFESYVKTHSAREAYASVLADVGATYPKQDVIDKRIIAEVRGGKVTYKGTRAPKYDPPGVNVPGFIDEPSDVKDALGSPDFPWPEYKTYNVPADNDHDGMADEWEKRAGLNPNDAADGNADRDGDGYTNLEEYLGWLVKEFPNPKK